jgi:hypothetical protein
VLPLGFDYYYSSEPRISNTGWEHLSAQQVITLFDPQGMGWSVDDGDSETGNHREVSCVRGKDCVPSSTTLPAPAKNGWQYLPRILALPFAKDEHRGIDDYSHMDLSGSRTRDGCLNISSEISIHNCG